MKKSKGKKEIVPLNDQLDPDLSIEELEERLEMQIVRTETAMYWGDCVTPPVYTEKIK